MKILHIAHITNTPFSGVCSVVPEYIKSQHIKADVALLNVANEKINGIEHCFLYKNNWKNSVSLEYQNPDIVIFHEVYYWPYIQIAKDLFREKIPYVIIPHGCLVKDALRKKWLKKYTANFLFFNAFIKKAQAVQCLSEKELINTHFSVHKFICTNGISLPQIIKHGFHAEGLNITYIGRLDVHVKGLDIMITAVKNISEVLRQHKVQINLFGPDVNGMFSKIESMITYNQLNDIIILHHEISGKEKVDTLYNSDIFIQTSRHEGMPMGILEAMSYGIPCLITEGTSLGDDVEQANAGWVAKTNSKSIAESFILMLNDKQMLLEKSKNARRLIETKYSWPIITSQTIKVYKSIIENKTI